MKLFQKRLKDRYLNAVIVFLCLSAFSLVWTGCALQVSPGGGEIDKTPPAVTEAYPPDGEMNYAKDYFELTFSEYVDKRSFKDAIFISPAIEGELDINWTNKTVEVRFPEKLKANRTYTITIGTDVVDYNNRNRMASAYTLRFSTGNRIDNGRVEGLVYDPKPSGIMIYAYLMDSADVNPAYKKPDYISQVGDSGSFVLQGLTPGKYRILAMRDEFKDFLFQPDQDEIGVTSRDVNLSETDTLVSGINFQMQKIDTLKPRLLSAAMTDKYHLLASFSEELNCRKLQLEDIKLYDSTANRDIKIVGFFKGKAKEKDIVIAVKDTLGIANRIVLQLSNIVDKAGNVTDFDMSAVAASDKIDTLAPALISFDPRQLSTDVDYNKAKFDIYFDDFILPIKPNIVLQDTAKNKVETELIRVDDASFRVIPIRKLKPFTDYQLIVPVKDMTDLAGNSTDTVITVKYKTMNDLDYTGVYGVVQNYDREKPALLELRSSAEDTLRYGFTLPPDGKFSFEKIIPGKYRLYLYYDTNRNGKWDDGKPFPFRPAEPAIYMKETVSLPARWSVTDVHFDAAGLK